MARHTQALAKGWGSVKFVTGQGATRLTIRVQVDDGPVGLLLDIDLVSDTKEVKSLQSQSQISALTGLIQQLRSPGSKTATEV